MGVSENMDHHCGLYLGRQREKEARYRTLVLPDYTNFEFDSVRGSAANQII